MHGGYKLVIENFVNDKNWYSLTKSEKITLLVLAEEYPNSLTEEEIVKKYTRMDLILKHEEEIDGERKELLIKKFNTMN